MLAMGIVSCHGYAWGKIDPDPHHARSWLKAGTVRENHGYQRH